MGFNEVDREDLLAIRGNLLRGLDLLAPHVAAGTLHVTPTGAHTPPAASGWLMTILLDQINAELRTRKAGRSCPITDTVGHIPADRR